MKQSRILIFPERGTIQEKKNFIKKVDGLVKKDKVEYVLMGDMVDDSFGNIKPTNLSKQK